MKILLSSLIVLLSMDCFAQFRHAEYVSPCVEHSAGEVAVGIKLASESDIVQWSASVMCASDGNAHVNLKGGFYVARVKGYRLLMCPFYLHGIVVPQKGFRYNTPTSLQVDKLYRDITVAVGADFFL